MSIVEEKKALRAWATDARARVLAQSRAAVAESIAGHARARLDLRAGLVVSCFASMPDEIDTGPLLAAVAATGATCCLPVIQGRGLPLLFRAWRPGDEMGRGMWGIAEPLPSQPNVEPDVVLAPLLAFDAAGWRLGYGGGYFDRTLARLRAMKRITAIGIGLDELEVAAVPHLDYDQRLDGVLTASGLRQLEG